MKYCYECDRPINGFAYGFGFNKICSSCNDKEQNQRESLKIQREMLQIERERLKLLKEDKL